MRSRLLLLPQPRRLLPPPLQSLLKLLRLQLLPQLLPLLKRSNTFALRLDVVRNPGKRLPGFFVIRSYYSPPIQNWYFHLKKPNHDKRRNPLIYRYSLQLRL